MADFLLQDGDPEDDDPSETLFLQRWVDRPVGELELVELPLTPELFLEPQIEDKFLQGSPASERETAYLLQSETMRRRLLEAMQRKDGIPFEEVCETLGIYRNKEGDSMEFQFRASTSSSRK